MEDDVSYSRQTRCIDLLVTFSICSKLSSRSSTSKVFRLKENFPLSQIANISSHSQPVQALSKFKLVVKLIYRPIASRPPTKPPKYTKIFTGLEILRVAVVVESLGFVGREVCVVTPS